jgi:AraC-like DNA-binding protein
VTTLTLLDFASTASMLGLSLLAIVLARGKPRTRATLFLTGYFVCIAVDSVVGLTAIGWHASLSPGTVRWLHVANVPLGYLYGVLLYGYVVALTSSGTDAPRAGQRWHLQPFIVVLAFSLANALLALDTKPAGAVAFAVSYHAWVFFGLAYLLMAVQRIYRSRPLLEQSQADESSLRLTWVRSLTLLLAVTWLGMAAERVTSVAGIAEPSWLGASMDGLTLVSMYVLAWFGLRQPMLIQEDPGDAPARATTTSGTPYAKSALDPHQCTTMAAELSRLVADEHLYVDSQFDLQALSERSGWSPNYVSQAINQGLGKNFFEFINGFRVAAAERYLADSEDRRSILDIALASGFGSKSTFNAVFKRLTGRTPSECRRRHALSLDVPAA